MLVTYGVTYLPAFKMDDVDMIVLSLVLVNIGYAFLLGRKLNRKRKRSCWAHEWLLDRDNPAKKSMIDL